MAALLNEIIENNDIISNINTDLESKPKQKRRYKKTDVSSYIRGFFS